MIQYTRIFLDTNSYQKVAKCHIKTVWMISVHFRSNFSTLSALGWLSTDAQCIQSYHNYCI